VNGLGELQQFLVFWISALAAGVLAIVIFLGAYPGDVIPQVYLLVLGGISAFLQAIVGFISRPKPPEEPV